MSLTGHPEVCVWNVNHTKQVKPVQLCYFLIVWLGSISYNMFYFKGHPDFYSVGCDIFKKHKCAGHSVMHNLYCRESSIEASDLEYTSPYLHLFVLRLFSLTSLANYTTYYFILFHFWFSTLCLAAFFYAYPVFRMGILFLIYTFVIYPHVCGMQLGHETRAGCKSDKLGVG